MITILGNTPLDIFLGTLIGWGLGALVTYWLTAYILLWVLWQYCPMTVFYRYFAAVKSE